MADYSKESLQKLLVDTITHHSPLRDVAIVIKSGADPNGPVSKGLRPVHYATYENYVQCIKLLVHFGADVNLPDHLGYTPMLIASKYGYYDAMEALLDSGAVVNFDDQSESSKALAYLTIHPLNSAIENNHTNCVELLLKRGCSPNQNYFLGNEINLVPLENLECMSILLKYGADPNAVSRGGLTVLMKACRENNTEVVDLILKYDADVNFQCPPRFDQKRALHFAALSGSVEVCRKLLEKGADTSIPPDYKYGPMKVAITEGRADICRLLLDHGANPNEINSEGASLLQIACATADLQNQYTIIEMLLNASADPHYCSAYPSIVGPALTPLVEYFTNNDNIEFSLVKLLVKHGSGVAITQPTRLFKILDPHGLLPQIRKLRPYEDIFHFLIEVAEKFDFRAITDESSLSNGQKELLLERASQPISLKHLSRLMTRKTLCLPVLKSLRLLPLPKYLVDYLEFEVV